MYCRRKHWSTVVTNSSFRGLFSGLAHFFQLLVVILHFRKPASRDLVFGDTQRANTKVNNSAPMCKIAHASSTEIRQD